MGGDRPPKPKIVLVHRYFWPDSPPYSSILRSIAESLGDDGWDVTVLTTQPSYGTGSRSLSRPRVERVNGVLVRRTLLVSERFLGKAVRLLNSLLFASQVWLVVRREKHDVVMAATTPPLVVAYAAASAAKRSGKRMVYHCQDIYPEVAEVTQIVRRGGFVAKFLTALDTRTMQRAAAIVVLSADMREAVRSRRDSLGQKTIVINNFKPDKHHSTMCSLDSSKRVLATGRRRVIFAGNLGNFQDLETVIESARILRRSDIEWLFVGEGKAKARLLDMAGDMVDNTVFFIGRVSQRDAEELIADSDVALVSLAPNLISYVYPSKTMTYLAAGAPIIVTAAPSSEIASLVTSKGLGETVRPGMPKELAAAVQRVLADPDPEGFRNRCIDYSNENLSKEHQITKWEALFEGLLNGH